jgi:hypothetical protein
MVMSDFKPGDLVWMWDSVAGQPASGIVLEVQESFSSPTLVPRDSVFQYAVLANGRRRLLCEDRLKRSREDCKWPALFTEDVVTVQPMTAPVSEGLFEWKRKGEDDE